MARKTRAQVYTFREIMLVAFVILMLLIMGFTIFFLQDSPSFTGMISPLV